MLRADRDGVCEESAVFRAAGEAVVDLACAGGKRRSVVRGLISRTDRSRGGERGPCRRDQGTPRGRRALRREDHGEPAGSQIAARTVRLLGGGGGAIPVCGRAWGRGGLSRATACWRWEPVVA